MRKKKIILKEKTNKLVLSCLSFRFLDMCAFVLYFCALLSKDYCTKKRKEDVVSVSLSLIFYLEKHSKFIVENREIGGLVVRGFSVLKKRRKHSFVYLLPSSDSVMGTGRRHRVPVDPHEPIGAVLCIL